MDIYTLLELTTQHRASDLHLGVGHAPILRVEGRLQPLDTEPLTEKQINDFCVQLTMPDQRERLRGEKSIDFAFHLPEVGRFRVNIFNERRGLALSLRLIPETAPDLEAYRNFKIMQTLLSQDSGLILVTGATGSGKSTTLAAMLEYLNQHKALHAITLEDPIEFIFTHRCSLIHQREIGRDVKSFSAGLREALREDPDFIVLGELRDLESIRLALQAAETGHLILASLHARSAAKAIDRLVDSFPGDEKNLILLILAETLIGVFHQVLMPLKDSNQRELIQEILINTPAIRNLIREHKIAQIEATMETSQHLGMKTLAQALGELNPPGDSRRHPPY